MYLDHNPISLCVSLCLHEREPLKANASDTNHLVHLPKNQCKLHSYS